MSNIAHAPVVNFEVQCADAPKSSQPNARDAKCYGRHSQQHRKQNTATLYEMSRSRFAASGQVAHERVSPLLPSDWEDTTSQLEVMPDFLWENAPRAATKQYRDNVKVYSHLPNGTDILDNKWALGRLFSDSTEADENSNFAKLETHCFRGLDGFQAFGQRVKLFDSNPPQNSNEKEENPPSFPDIMNSAMDLSKAPDAGNPSNLWVVKDAMANGAGGVWVVGPENASAFASQSSSPLYPEHRYVAQRYVWPPVLFDGRKCHVRMYTLFTSDNEAFVHNRAFLHVANDKFTTSDAKHSGVFQDSIHITNCCANSHDDSKFAGEILADFEQTEYTERDGQSVVPLAAFFPSIKSCISFLAKKAFPFLQGGQANNGFEYMGIDFMLSYNDKKEPVAYILEINAPPSQDTATGLTHAENLHNDVIRDLTTLWVLPKVTGAPSNPGGWRRVYSQERAPRNTGETLIAPSKATIINKIRWTMFEKKALKLEKEALQALSPNQNASPSETIQGTQHGSSDDHLTSKEVVDFARSQFPYFTDAIHRPNSQVFLESAGGSQVAQPVIDAVGLSLRYRHRDCIGAKTKKVARRTIQTLLGARGDDTVFLGPNATTLLSSLADRYVRFGLLKVDDEIVVSTENHRANFDPWIEAAQKCGAKIKLWTPFGDDSHLDLESSGNLTDLVTPKTRIVAIPHASNLLGQVRDIQEISARVRSRSEGYTHVVVDGVAAVPHCFANFADANIDWYVISCHKVFGPHVGALCGKRRGAVEQLLAKSAISTASDDVYKLLESGTVNYEGCAGVVGLGIYFDKLSCFDAVSDQKSMPQESSTQSSGDNGTIGSLLATINLTIDKVKQAYDKIRIAEVPLVIALYEGLRQSKKVRILENSTSFPENVSRARAPTISFLHSSISSQLIVSTCSANGITCRLSSFLCTHYLAGAFGFDITEGVIRVSLAHYNTIGEVKKFLQLLRSIPDWM